MDFKLITTLFDKNDKKNLSKAISGFANSAGGMVVWGVDSRRDADDIDAALPTPPFPNIAAAHSRLLSLTGEATSPIVDGVDHRVIEDPAVPGAGYLVTFVPPSDIGPHMARMADGRYYKRSGDSFYPMEHFDLADMFGRRAHPVLEVQLNPAVVEVSSGSNGRAALIHVVVALTNTGRGMARFPFFRLKPCPPYRVARGQLDGNGRAGLPLRAQSEQQSDWSVYAGGINDVVHPDTSLPVTTIAFNVPEQRASVTDLVVDYTLASEGERFRAGQKVLPGSLFLEHVRARLAVTR